ncbi:hypothetical protein F8388_001093, partial [Cannabis sativa]
MNKTNNESECESKCLTNCSCMAYTYSYTNALCALWFGDLFDIQQLLSRGQHTYIRIPNLEIAPKIHNETRADGSRRK